MNKLEFTKIFVILQTIVYLFNNTLMNKILTTDRGQEALYKQIVAANKPDYTKYFMDLIDRKVKLPNGTMYPLFRNADEVKEGLRGQFLKNFFNASQKEVGQYNVLDAAQAAKFLRQHKHILDDPNFLTASQKKNLDDYAKALKFTTGKVTAPGAAGEGTGKIFIQLKQAGAVTQIGGLLLASETQPYLLKQLSAHPEYIIQLSLPLPVVDNQNINMLLTAALYMGVCAILLAWLFPLTRRLYLLTNTAAQIGAGNLTTRMPLSRFSYISLLENSFNRMSKFVNNLS